MCFSTPTTYPSSNDGAILPSCPPTPGRKRSRYIHCINSDFGFVPMFFPKCNSLIHRSTGEYEAELVGRVQDRIISGHSLWNAPLAPTISLKARPIYGTKILQRTVTSEEEEVSSEDDEIKNEGNEVNEEREEEAARVISLPSSSLPPPPPFLFSNESESTAIKVAKLTKLSFGTKEQSSTSQPTNKEGLIEQTRSATTTYPKPIDHQEEGEGKEEDEESMKQSSFPHLLSQALYTSAYNSAYSSRRSSFQSIRSARSSTTSLSGLTAMTANKAGNNEATKTTVAATATTTSIPTTNVAGNKLPSFQKSGMIFHGKKQQRRNSFVARGA